MVTLFLHLAGAHGLADCEALIATGWARQTGWIVNTTNPAWCCANQYGILCNMNATRVEQLYLAALGLQGMFRVSNRIVD